MAVHADPNPVVQPICNGSLRVTTHQARTDDGAEAGWVEVFTYINGKPFGVTARPPLSVGWGKSVCLDESATLADGLAALAAILIGA